MKLQEIYDLIEMYSTPAPPGSKWKSSPAGETFEFSHKGGNFRIYLKLMSQDFLTRFDFPNLRGKKIYQIMFVQQNSQTGNWQTELTGNMGYEAIAVFSIILDALERNVGQDAVYVFAAKPSKDKDEITFRQRVSFYDHLAIDLSIKKFGGTLPIVYNNDRGETVFVLSKQDISSEFETLKKYGAHLK